MTFTPVEFGKYRLIEPLKQGGMAEIFLAKQLGPMGYEKNVVIKRVLSHLSTQNEFVEMFLDEARLAARLAHPNIVQIHDFGEADGTYFLCMEHLRGEDLHTLMREARKQQIEIPAQVAAIIVAAACEALHYAHTLLDDDGQPLHIVHRDVSPSNTFVTYQGQVKVLDFGIARAEGKLVKTSVGTIRGKLAYMAPEQARGLVVDARSDVWALGVVLFELLTGVRCFSRKTEAATIQALMVENIPGPIDLIPTVPKELDAICRKALQRAVEDRYADAHEMYVELDDYLASRTYIPAHTQLQQFIERVMGKPPVTSGSTAPRPMPAHGAAGPVPEPLSSGTRTAATVSDRAMRRPVAPQASTVVAAGPVKRDAPTPAPLPPAAVSPLGSRLFIAGVLVTLCLVSAAAAVWIARGLREPVAPAIQVATGQTVRPVPAAAVEPDEPPAAAEPAADVPAAPDTPHPDAEPAVAAAPKPKGPARGQLDVNCVPWCQIWIDDKDLNRTSPAVGITLSAGKHRLKVVNPGTGLEQEREVVVRAGATQKEIVKF